MCSLALGRLLHFVFVLQTWRPNGLLFCKS
jgi:hypothetical protein